MDTRPLPIIALVALLSCSGDQSAAKPDAAPSDSVSEVVGDYRTDGMSASSIKYLMFQIFTGTGDPAIPIGAPQLPHLDKPASKAQVRAVLDQIQERVAKPTRAERKLGFSIGPIALDQSDGQVATIIREAFELADELDMAISIHMDDVNFWSVRTDLLEPQNIEWVDWDGTKPDGRDIGWIAARDAPQACLNSPSLVAALRARAKLIGQETAKGWAGLRAKGKEHLFAGIIVGWETGVAPDDQGRKTGFCALAHLGFDKNNPPLDWEAELDAVVKRFIEEMAHAVADGGVPRTHIYSHTAFIASGATATAATIGTHPAIEVGLSDAFHPGYSTYPVHPTIFTDLWQALGPHRKWAGVEGTDISEQETMESYLAKHYNHGASMVTIFGWGIGGEANKEDPIRVGTEGPDALLGYAKFLAGEPLFE